MGRPNGEYFPMKWLGILAGGLALVGATAASAEMRIQRDFGGRIGHYLDRYAMVRASGQRVVIDGACLSACTLVLAVVPAERICVTPRAILGFHAARSAWVRQPAGWGQQSAGRSAPAAAEPGWWPGG